MEEMKCTYDVFAFSPRALLLRRILCVLAHPTMLALPVAAAVFIPHHSNAAAAAFLLSFFLILLRRSRKSALKMLDTLARRDAKALRLRDPQRYNAIRHRLFSDSLSFGTTPNTCSVSCIPSL